VNGKRPGDAQPPGLFVFGNGLPAPTIQSN
jgi:hypothetical protein